MKKLVLNQSISARKPELPSLGQLLREARTCRGLSQTELAEKLGVSKQHLSAIENGVVMISFSKASEIAKVLQLSAEVLVVASFYDHVRAAGISISSALRTSLAKAVQLAGKERR
jgi:transcriptional regulator with XRE-family HTH domain